MKLSFLKPFSKLRFVDIFVSLKIDASLFSRPLRLKRASRFFSEMYVPPVFYYLKKNWTTHVRYFVPTFLRLETLWSLAF